MNNKSELLEQLKIDRTEGPQPAGLSLWKVLLIALGSCCIAVVLTLSFIDQPEPQVIAEDARQLQAIDLENQSISESNFSEAEPVLAKLVDSEDAILNASGYITARRMATVSSEIMGLITEVNVEEGMLVSKDQILAKLDDELASINYDLARAQVEVLEARYQSVKANLQEAELNNQRVVNNRFSSDAERSGALANLQSLGASLESAEADIRVARLEAEKQQERLADHTIRAPFAGVVTVKNAQTGEIVAPTSAGGGFTRTGICTIVDMQSLEIEVDVNESFIGRVAPGQRVVANLDAYPDWDIPASVIAIIPTADRAKATVRVRIKIESEDPRILPDMGVKVAFYNKA